MICVFPVWSRQSSPSFMNDENSLEYDLLIYVANWPERRSTCMENFIAGKSYRKSMLCYWRESRR